MATWLQYPDCLPIQIEVEELIKEVDPLWIGLAFLIAFIAGSIIGILLGYYCSKWYIEKERKDEEEATLIALNIPLHKRGTRKRDLIDTTSPSGVQDQGLMLGREVTMLHMAREVTTISMRPTTPSNITLTDTPAGFSDALIQTTEEGAEAEISNQDVKDILELESFLLNQRVKGFIIIARQLLTKLVDNGKIMEEDSQAVIKRLTDSADEIIDNCKNEAIAEQTEISAKSKDVNSIATQSDLDAIHSKYTLKLNKQLNEVEKDFNRQLNAFPQLKEGEIEAISAKLTHQLATREKKIGDESQRQLLSLEMKLARRKELLEQNRLRKDAEKTQFQSKLENQSTVLDMMIDQGNMDEETKEKVLQEYEQKQFMVITVFRAGREEQERMLNDKLRRERHSKLKKLDNRHQKELDSFDQSCEKGEKDDQDLNSWDKMLYTHRAEKEKLLEELDFKEFTEMMDLYQSWSNEHKDEFADMDREYFERLEEAGLEQADIDKIIKLHKAQMKDLNQRRKNQEATSNAKLQERLAARRAKLQEKHNATPIESNREFNALREKQEETIMNVIHNSADLTDEAMKRIMEEHSRNVTTLNSQMMFSKARQEKQMEERLAQRRARLADKVDQQEQLKLSNDKKKEQEAKKLQQEIENDKQRIVQDREAAIKALRESLLAETRESLKAQEEEIAGLIGQLEVGRARRQNILKKQDKMIDELQSQIANKVKDNTATEVMQRHQGQVQQLLETQQIAKERQEAALQERLDTKRLQREAEIREVMKMEAKKELEKMRTRGAGAAAQLLVDMMLQQRHEQAMADLEKEMKIDLQRARDEMNENLHNELMSSLGNEGKEFMTELAVTAGLSNDDLMEAMDSAANNIQANDQTVKKLAKEMKVRVKTARGERRQQQAY